ncbi:MAG: hypothetical protein ACFFG0_10400 [Candidatus Thorarchaeota archaeon]
METRTKYIITKDCFVGYKGDKLLVDWDHYDGAEWENLTQKTRGCPFSETDCVRKVSDREWDLEDKKKNYEKYVYEQNDVAHALAKALHKFETNADMPMFCTMEKEFGELRAKLTEVINDTQSFVREFDEEEDW